MQLLHLALSLLFHFVTSEDWIRHTILDGDGKYHLYWNPPNDTKGDSKITFKVEVQAKGYFGFGLSPNGGMPGSDIVTGWVKDGKVYFQDRHAVGYSLPLLDDQQNWELIDGSENETHTIFKIRRKLDTCDEDDMVINESTMRVIYAYSEDDPTGEDPFYHQQKRGSKSVLLLQGRSETNLDLSSLLHWDLRSDDIDMSNYRTLYWCKIFKAPTLDVKNHIVHMEPLIQEGYEQFMHHILLYECVGGEYEEFEPLVNVRGHECRRPDTPAPMYKCDAITIGSAIGGEGVTFPEHVGLPLYPPPEKYYLLEIHYDNPQLETGIINQSGLIIYHTPEERKYDAGYMGFGSAIAPLMFIPPGQQTYVVAGHSTTDCLAPAFPVSGIKPFTILLHGHLLARRIKVRHFRGNKELLPLADDVYYDFNYQAFRHIDEVDILPNDQITVECTYDSSQRSNVTLGGWTTEEEMCLVFMLYYPAMERYGSVSVPTVSNVDQILKTNSPQLEVIANALMSHDWASEDMTKVEDLMRYSEQMTFCYFGNGTIDAIKTLTSYPSDLEPFIPEESTCTVSV